ncbi:MAG: amidohydrolase [Pirellulales bacterium]
MIEFPLTLRGMVFTLGLVIGLAQSLAAESPAEWAKAHADELVLLYTELHQAPELSKHEVATGRRIGEELKKLAIETTTEVGGTGVVGLLKNGPGPVVMLRTDLDALPVTEQTGLPYASKVRVRDEQGNDVGVMHACGHDIHMANLIGVARYLASHRDQWSGTVMFIGQPAEERGAGARAMLEDGLFTRFPKPDVALALHVDSAMPTGKVGFRAGPNMANVDSVDITLKGRGGHGAYPHMTIDPVAMAAYLIVDLQSIVAREIGPTDPAVITVGSIHGGAKHNVIDDTCHLQLTVRSYTDEVREHLLNAIRRKSLAVAKSFRAPEPVIALSEGTPALSNDAALVERVVPVFRRELGDENVLTAEPTMGGEDFSEYGRAGVPIFMYRLGSVDQPRLDRFRQLGVDPPTLHSPLYYPEPRETLTTGVTTMAAAVLELLPKNK